ncbi:TetR/AcrR family transcriptional regulator [Undibacterium sp. TJN19]|uniref:TetR/AcrR family transcriptional regulator n=1 Tax=Undibacterium sp. TJN19 TaxID=3413055 RepID=UPI003BF0F1DB
MTTSDAKASPYLDTRERVLMTGQQLISGRGFTAIGLGELLAAAEVPKGSFYHYFQSKEGFGVAMLDRYFATYLASTAALFKRDIPAREQLLTYFSNWRQIADSSACHDMCLAIKLAAEVADLSEPMRVALSTGMQGITRQIAGVLKNAQAQGSLAADRDTQELAEALYGMWVGASLLTKVNRDIRPLDLAYKQTESILKL